MAYDLILQTYPSRDLAGDDFDTIQQHISQNETLQRLCEVTLGQFAAGNVDVLVLGEGLDFGDFSEPEFVEFCTSRGLPPNRQDEAAASAFVRNRFGFPVATFKLSASEQEARTAYSEIVRFALQHGLRVIDPQKGDDIDLQNPALLPSKW